MAMNNLHLLRNTLVSKEPAWLLLSRTYAAGGKAKKGGKGGGSTDAPKSTLSKEVKSTTVVGANILKDGTDPKVLADSEYPDWLWHLLDKRLPLSELQRMEAESLSYEDLKRFVKLFVVVDTGGEMHSVWLHNKQICYVLSKSWGASKSMGKVARSSSSDVFSTGFHVLCYGCSGLNKHN